MGCRLAIGECESRRVEVSREGASMGEFDREWLRDMSEGSAAERESGTADAGIGEKEGGEEGAGSGGRLLKIEKKR
ncbi:hypothetical protein VNO78_20030 [Psophocarpus tetragonolobus]|uniref:Uncharacterized protein n=1 Tax=Psophocarpus tetragonolobus TaxID=3891 RepID=A0AAN9XH56_PSOTE